MNNFFVDLEQNEVEEIENYFERMNSLKALSLAFESDEVFSKNSMMYEKIVKDISDTRQRLQAWWSKIIDKYCLEKYDIEKLFVDFSANQIRLIS